MKIKESQQRTDSSKQKPMIKSMTWKCDALVHVHTKV